MRVLNGVLFFQIVLAVIGAALMYPLYSSIALVFSHWWLLSRWSRRLAERRRRGRPLKEYPLD